MFPTRALISPRRMDIAVKWRFFNHILNGNDPESERVYRWHIETRAASNRKANLGMDRKLDTDQYVNDSLNLAQSMNTQGFLPGEAVPVDPGGELLGGVHRTACALALGITAIPIIPKNTRVWAPHWGLNWFLINKIPKADLDRLLADWSILNSMRAKA